MDFPEFESRADVQAHFSRKYPQGTDRATISKADKCQPDGEGLSLSFAAPNHVGSRHYVDADGQPGCLEMNMRWCVWFIFDPEGKLGFIEVELVPLPC
jgi:hypothetical protein